MDNLTHALVGGALAKAGLDRRTPLATGTLVLAASAPDIDVLAYAWGPYHALAFRRGITHGVPALAVLPFAVTGVMLAWDRWVRRRDTPNAPAARALPLLGLSAIGVASHPALDWLNTYGMRWWLPVDGGWSYGDTLFIVDPWLWLMLGCVLFLTGSVTSSARLGWGALGAVASALILASPIGWMAKLVWVGAISAAIWARLRRDSRPLPAPARSNRDRRMVRATVGASTAYLAVMLVLHHLVVGRVVASVGGAGRSGSLMVSPAPADPFATDVVVLLGDRYVRGTHEWLRTPSLVLGTPADLPMFDFPPGIDPDLAAAAVAGAREAPEVADFLVWSRFPVFRVDRDGEGFSVSVGDARYAGAGAGSLEGLRVRLGADFRPLPG